MFPPIVSLASRSESCPPIVLNKMPHTKVHSFIFDPIGRFVCVPPSPPLPCFYVARVLLLLYYFFLMLLILSLFLPSLLLGPLSQKYIKNRFRCLKSDLVWLVHEVLGVCFLSTLPPDSSGVRSKVCIDGFVSIMADMASERK